ncbi:MAG: TonB family protein [Prevotellaceae bacterium]|jgi:TonB family protein|nr:TonB family protein [Prevotellaceae bacterium]
MKKSILLLLGVIISCCLFSNNPKIENATTNVSAKLAGDWKIDKLINNARTEYTIHKPDTTYGWDYGNHITFNADGTFQSYYTAPCGNDCFPTTSGNYNQEGKNYIRFTLKRITVDGDCPNSDTQMNKNLGLFYVHRDSTNIILIRSNAGIPQKDIQKINYLKSLQLFRNDLDYSHSRYRWQRVESKEISEAISKYFEKTSATKSDIKVLYSLKNVREESYILVEKAGKQYYCQSYNGYKNMGIYVPADMNEKFEKVGEIYTWIPRMPHFPGGDSILMKYISKNFYYPQNNIKGEVLVGFVVNEEGKIKNVKVVKGLDPECDAETVRFIKRMPKWIPGVLNGEAVSVYYEFPIPFR